MPVVFVHGVANRENASYDSKVADIQQLLKRYVCPVISDSCQIFTAYWGGAGAQFAWDGDSRPKSVILGKGPEAKPTDLENALTIASLDPALIPLDVQKEQSLLMPLGTTESSDSSGTMRLKDLSADELGDLLSVVVVATTSPWQEHAGQLVACDEVAHSAGIQDELDRCANLEEEIDLLGVRLKAHPSTTLVGQGGSSIWDTLLDRAKETASRVGSVPGYVASAVIEQARRPINNAITLFLGDVFVYLNSRGKSDEPGAISNVVLDTLRQAKNYAPEEPLVVLTHSMGGQIVYDLVTHYLPQAKSDIRIDYWCATASQVGLFEEMKLFRASDPQYSKKTGVKVPFPDRKYLGGWWNVWDHNDFISFTASPIFDGVDDDNYTSGVSVITAHSEYLARPSFYRRFGSKLRDAAKAGWNCP